MYVALRCDAWLRCAYILQPVATGCVLTPVDTEMPLPSSSWLTVPVADKAIPVDQAIFSLLRYTCFGMVVFFVLCQLSHVQCSPTSRWHCCHAQSWNRTNQHAGDRANKHQVLQLHFMLHKAKQLL